MIPLKCNNFDVHKVLDDKILFFIQLCTTSSYAIFEEQILNYSLIIFRTDFIVINKILLYLITLKPNMIMYI